LSNNERGSKVSKLTKSRRDGKITPGLEYQTNYKLVPYYFWRRSQVVRQRSAKPPFAGSNPAVASKKAGFIAGFFCFL
jgi:hypothetical protein